MLNRNTATTGIALLLVALLGFAVYAERRDQADEAAALNHLCAAEPQRQAGESDALTRRNLACVGWRDPAMPDIQTPEG